MQPLYLIDASIYIFRAYFSIPEHLTDAEGNPANAVYGFANFLATLLKKTQAAYIAVAFDESLTTATRSPRRTKRIARCHRPSSRRSSRSVRSSPGPWALKPS